MSKTHIIVHIVFATKHRRPTIPIQHKRLLYSYIYGIIKHYGCTLRRMNGMSDHVHILIDLNPTIALADLVKKIKQSSTTWLKTKTEFPKFERWEEGYYAASIGPEQEDLCINYIINQETHHLGEGFVDEMKLMALKHHLDWDDRDWKT